MLLFFSSGGLFVLTVDPNVLCNFGGGHYIKHSMKKYFEFRPVVKMLFKYISIFNSGSHFIQWSKTVCAILVESITRIISVKIF